MIEDAGLYTADVDMCCMVCGDELDTYVHLPMTNSDLPNRCDAVVECVCITCALLHTTPA